MYPYGHNTVAFFYISQEIQEALRKREEELAKSSSPADATLPVAAGSSDVNVNAHAQRQNHGILNNTLANVAVIVGFALFAYSVKFVIRNLVDE